MTERPAPLIGRRLVDRYRIDALVARGGMAVVYRAHDDRLERDVAIKVLSPPYADDPAFTERFLAEARAAASLSHPSLVHVYDSGSDAGAHFIVMELLDRHRTLRAVLDERGRLPAGEVLRIAAELLAGLAAVHGRGLVHCDVKASNVMLGPGPAKLIDFGIARSPHAGAGDDDTSIGSLHAMSPEQLHGEALTPASDLFSLGVVLYEALTGRLPFSGTTPVEVARSQREDAVRPPSALVDDVPPRVDGAILQALRRDPDERYRSAQAMARALSFAAGDPPAPKEPAGADDETRVVPVQRSGYVPPPVPNVVEAPSSAPAPARRIPRVGPRSPRRAPLASLVGTAAVLGAAALVIAFVVAPLLGLGGDGGGGTADPSVGPSTTPTIAANVVPSTVGLPTDEAIDLATAAGLDWTVRCQQDPTKPEGIIDQEPPAGTAVRPGAPFTMYSARISDCR